MPENMDTEVLAQLVDAKFKLLSQLRQIALRQVELVEAGDITRIMSLLAVKQGLLNAVHQTEERLDPFRQEDPERRVWASPAHRQRAREISERCDALLREIMTLERRGESQLALRRDCVAEQIQGLHHSAQVAHAYMAVDDHAGGQFDVSCET